MAKQLFEDKPEELEMTLRSSVAILANPDTERSVFCLRQMKWNREGAR